jgi:hypothetical protein
MQRDPTPEQMAADAGYLAVGWGELSHLAFRHGVISERNRAWAAILDRVAPGAGKIRMRAEVSR